MTTSIRTWPDSLFYLSGAGSANIAEQLRKVQVSTKLLRVLSDASTVDTNGDKLQDRLLGVSLGDLNQRHKWRVLYDNSNDRFLVQRNTGTDASKVWSERFRIDASGNVTTTGTLSATAVTVREVEGLVLGGDLDMNQFYIRNAEDIQTETIRVTGQLTLPNNHTPGLVYITSKTAASAAVIDFTGLTDYPAYVVMLDNVRPGTNDARLQLRVSVNGGASFVSSGYDSIGLATTVLGPAAQTASGAAAWDVFAVLAGQDADSAATGLSGELRLVSLGSTTLPYRFTCQAIAYIEAATLITHSTMSGSLATLGTSLNALRFAYSSGTIASGTFRLYGLRAS